VPECESVKSDLAFLVKHILSASFHHYPSNKVMTKFNDGFLLEFLLIFLPFQTFNVFFQRMIL